MEETITNVPNIEVKTVKDSSSIYLCFGWKFAGLEQVRKGRHHIARHIYQRDKNMPNYAQLALLEQDYWSLKASKKEEPEYSFMLSLILLLLFIIPGVFYIVVKFAELGDVRKYNNDLSKRMDEIFQKAETLSGVHIS